MASPSDEYLGRLLQALQGLPDERAARLVEEAWSEAETSVRDILTTAMRAALLRRTVSLLEAGQPESPPASRPEARRDVTPEPRREPEPAPPATGTGSSPGEPAETTGDAWYVYGIAPGGSVTLPADLTGVDPRFTVDVVSRDGLDAITSPVTTAEFGPDALRERLADRGWLEERVRLHEDVIRYGLDAEALVPMRFCTIVRSAEGLADFLAEHGERLRRTLVDLAGKREWGVRVAIVPDRFEEHVRVTSEELRRLDARAGEAGAGTAYFMDKRRQQLVDDESDRIASEAAGRWHDRLAQMAADAVLLPVRRRDEGDDERGHRLVLNGAYLVDRADEEAFAEAVDAIAGEAEGVGLGVALTGPWPAYSFVDDDIGAEAAG